MTTIPIDETNRYWVLVCGDDLREVSGYQPHDIQAESTKVIKQVGYDRGVL